MQFPAHMEALAFRQVSAHRVEFEGKRDLRKSFSFPNLIQLENYPCAEWAWLAHREKKLYREGTALLSGICQFHLQSVAGAGYVCLVSSGCGWLGCWSEARGLRASYLSGAGYLEAELQLPGRMCWRLPLWSALVGTPTRPFQVNTLWFLPAGMPGLWCIRSLHCFDPLPVPPPSSGPFISC